MKIIRSVINFGINESFDNDLKSDYRKVNGILFAFSIIGFTSSIYPLLTGVYIHGYLQILGFILYLSGFIFVARGKIQTAKHYLIIIFELLTFIISFYLLLPETFLIELNFSPTFMFFVLYPILAATLNLKIINHLIVAIAQIAFFQAAYYFDINIYWLELSSINITLSFFICLIYLLVLGTVFVYLLVHENNRLKGIENRYSKELEFALSNLNESLGELKKKKEALQFTKEELENLNSTKNRLFSIIAHDLRSPLNAIIGFTDLMLHRSCSEDKKGFFLQQLNSTARTTFELLDNLLQWARSQSDRIEFNPRSINLSEVVDACIIGYKTQITEKKLQAENQINKEQSIYADKLMLGTIIRNLLNNAIKYSYENTSIEIDAKEDDKNSYIIVRDFGVGMGREKQDEIFNFVYQESMPGTNHEMGTGLGLQLCREFTEKHGGEIKVESKEGEGSAFIVVLPRNP